MRQQEGLVARWQALMGHTSLPMPAHDTPPAHEDIRFEQVSFSYDGSPLLQGMDFEVKAGTSLALVGPSGSGKTTIARLLARFWDVDEGRITVGGVDIRQMQPATLAAHVSFVFQEIFLFSRSVKDNIRLGKPDASDSEIVAASQAARRRFYPGLARRL
ncbi:MAG TPA: hypothetical protein DD979_03080 [Gammaproteobacteria bacterium]|nr:hypothetical protein [Gammaproteobacteria bacterium]